MCSIIKCLILLCFVWFIVSFFLCPNDKNGCPKYLLFILSLTLVMVIYSFHSLFLDILDPIGMLYWCYFFLQYHLIKRFEKLLYWFRDDEIHLNLFPAFTFKNCIVYSIDLEDYLHLIIWKQIFHKKNLSFHTCIAVVFI